MGRNLLYTFSVEMNANNAFTLKIVHTDVAISNSIYEIEHMQRYK